MAVKSTSIEHLALLRVLQEFMHATWPRARMVQGVQVLMEYHTRASAGQDLLASPAVKVSGFPLTSIDNSSALSVQWFVLFPYAH